MTNTPQNVQVNPGVQQEPAADQQAPSSPNSNPANPNVTGAPAQPASAPVQPGQAPQSAPNACPDCGKILAQDQTGAQPVQQQ